MIISIVCMSKLRADFCLLKKPLVCHLILAPCNVSLFTAYSQEISWKLCCYQWTWIWMFVDLVPHALSWFDHTLSWLPAVPYLLSFTVHVPYVVYGIPESTYIHVRVFANAKKAREAHAGEDEHFASCPMHQLWKSHFLDNYWQDHFYLSEGEMNFCWRFTGIEIEISEISTGVQNEGQNHTRRNSQLEQREHTTICTKSVATIVVLPSYCKLVLIFPCLLFFSLVILLDWRDWETLRNSESALL